MSKQITFDYDGGKYTLEYTKRTVREMEREGFVAGDIENKPMTILPQLFAGAFKAHHRFIKAEVIEDIYSHFTDKLGLIERLGEMYNEPIASLVSEPDEGDEGNVIWTANW